MQDGPKDCGVCCLLMIVRYYGGNVSKEKLRELTNTTQSGVNAYCLLEAAKKIGFQGRGIKGELDKLDAFMLPCIAHVIINGKYQHFVVIEEINQKRRVLVVLDPAFGKKKYSFSEFETIYTKQYLYLKPKRQLPSFESNKFIRHFILSFIHKHFRILCIIFVLSFIYTILTMVIGFNFKFLMEYVFNYSSFQNAISISILIGAFVIFQLLFKLLRQKLLNVLEFKLATSLMADMIEQIVTLPYPYYKNRSTGEVLSRAHDIEELKTFFINFFGFIIFDFFQVIIILIVLFNFSSALTLFMLLFVMFSFIISFIVKPFINRHFKKIKEDNVILQTSFIETIEGVETVKGCHLEELMIDRIKHNYFTISQDNLRAKDFLLQVDCIKEHILQLGLVCLLCYGSNFVINEKLSITNLIMFYNFYFYFLSAIRNMMSFLFSLSSINVVIHRLEDLFEVKQEVFLTKEEKMISFVQGDIVFNHVNYSYQEHFPLLCDVCLHIYPKEKIVLYGPSGSGKSTLVKLLYRYFWVQDGNILLDSIDIKHYSLEDIRKHITYVSQQEILFTDTIYNNIVLDQEVDYELFLKVCRITKVDEIVRDYLLGYDQLLEENGFNLSGGERQRIVLARSILKKSSVYVFDEAFNQIDIKKEREILKEVFFFLRNCTVIVISHRFHNQDLFHRKIMMKDGTCFEGEEAIEGSN